MDLKKNLSITACCGSLAIVSACSLMPSGNTVTGLYKKNVVIIEVDDLMYRFMGGNGRNFVYTPNIDKLADSGVYFSNAVSQGVMCGPSRNSLICGLYPHNIGFYRNGQMGPLPDSIWSLPGALSRAGYQTAWIGKCHVHPPVDKSLKREEAMKTLGFDYSLASWDRFMLARRIKRGESTKGYIYFDYLKKIGLFEQYVEDCKLNRNSTLPENAYLDGYFTQNAIEWLKKTDTKKQPLFLWLNYSLPHGPHNVPEKYHKIYENKDIPSALSKDFGGVQIPNCLLKDNRAVSPERAAKIRKAYAATCTFLDKLIGQVIEELKEKGIYKDTVILFFSDHGIFMGNHGRIHKGTLFNEVTNPSLIISSSTLSRKGEIEKQPVELLDVVKTILDIAGASNIDKSIPYGRSLMPLLQKKNQKHFKNYVFSEIEGAQLCFDGRYRYIKTKEKSLLYDLKVDPFELNDISLQKKDISSEMDKKIKAWFKQSGKPLPANFLKNPEHRKNFKRKY
jgi:arylsulfatase A-like enzyme